jgi:hypothetical protein
MNRVVRLRRIRAFFLAVAVFAAGINAAAARPDVACEILSAEQVSAIVAATLKVTASTQSSEGVPTRSCTFGDGKTRAEVSLSRAADEHAAVKQYKSALLRDAGDASRGEPLHGVGIESRYQATEKGSTIVARFGLFVVVVSTNAGRQAAVGLARALEAKVARL